MTWLAIVIRLSSAPVLLGAVAVLMHTQRTGSDVGTSTGLLLLGAIHLAYWWNPWQRSQRQSVAAVTSMIVINFILLNLVGLTEPLLWLYPALVAGAGFNAPVAAVAIAATALAAAAPLALEGKLIHPIDPLHPAEALGPSHSVLLSIILAGLGMNAVRHLIALNADLHTTRAELANLAVATERERLSHELHDLLGRTLALIAVKAELASRLSAKRDPSADAELADVQRLARQAVRDVRDAITGSHAPTVVAELGAAAMALRTAGIHVSIENMAISIDPAHETTIAWAIREAVTNVVKHSGARTCRIALDAGDEGYTTLEVEDDGRGPGGADHGTGLEGLADRARALGGTLEAGPSDGRGFLLRVRLGTSASRNAGAARAR